MVSIDTVGRPMASYLFATTEASAFEQWPRLMAILYTGIADRAALPSRSQENINTVCAREKQYSLFERFVYSFDVFEWLFA